LAKTVGRILEETNCLPEWIELEITESMLLDEQGDVLDTLNQFRTMGIAIAIDDFGTGYSSLSYLARFPINTLKIDRIFVTDIAVDPHRAELVRAIISIARNLKLSVVAEGVDTQEQAAILQELGCQIAQGYLYGKPMPSAVFQSSLLSFGGTSNLGHSEKCRKDLSLLSC
jgi:EAL domain-containing protein (putative c-di-GMP-specific phosphodiesterase class I)